LWLHKQGYNFFTIPQLTYPETNSLIEPHNRNVIKKERDAKRAAMKSKGNRGRKR